MQDESDSLQSYEANRDSSARGEHWWRWSKLGVQAEEGRQQKASEAQSSNWSSKVSGINFDGVESHLWWRYLQSECCSDLRASLNVSEEMPSSSFSRRKRFELKSSKQLFRHEEVVVREYVEQRWQSSTWRMPSQSAHHWLYHCKAVEEFVFLFEVQSRRDEDSCIFTVGRFASVFLST